MTDLLVEHRFGTDRVVVEEFLVGPEVSLLAICDGERALPLASAQDYKRIFDGDAGPNTGGMGSYSPVPAIDADAAGTSSPRWCTSRCSTELRRRGIEFHGVLYAGLMLTPGRAPRCSSSTRASATRRRRRSCRGCGPTWSSCSRRPPAGGDPAWTASASSGTSAAP